MPFLRVLALVLATVALPMAARADGAAAGSSRGELGEWSTSFDFVIGAGWFRSDAGARSGVDAEAGLLVLHREVAVGPFLAAGGVGGNTGEDGVWYGVAAGWSHRLSDHVRLDVLAEGGAHTASVESPYAYEAAGTATLPFVGARAGLHVTGELFPTLALLYARRAGFGLQAAARTDLGRETVRPGSPAGAPASPAVAVGGQALSLGLVLVLEW